MSTVIGDSGNSYAREDFAKPPPPKKKWIQEYLEKAPPSPQVEQPPPSEPIKLKSLEELKFNKESNNAKPFTEEEVLAKLLDPVRNGDKFNKSLKRLSWNPEPEVTSVTPPNVEDVLDFMEETNISQHEVRGVVKGVISQFLNASLSGDEYRRCRKRTHKHNNSRHNNKEKGGYRVVYKQERSAQDPPLEKISKASNVPIHSKPAFQPEDANVVLNLSLPKKVHFSEVDNFYSPDCQESFQESKSKTLSNLEILANVSTGMHLPPHYSPPENNVTAGNKIYMDNANPKQLFITSPVAKTGVTSYSPPGNVAVFSKPDLLPINKTTLSSEIGVFQPVSRMVAAPLSVSSLTAPPTIPRIVPSTSISSLGAPATLPSIGAPPVMMVTYKVDPTVSVKTPSKNPITIRPMNALAATPAANLVLKPPPQVEALPLLKQPSPPPLLPKSVVIAHTTQQYSPKDSIPIRCGPMPPTQSPPIGLPRPIPRVIVETPLSFKKSSISPNPKKILIKPAVPFLTVIQPSKLLTAAPTAKPSARKPSPILSEKGDAATDEPKRTSCSREVHNRLEKNRRAHLKKCFDDLATEVELDPKKASNLTVIRGAYKYIQVLRRKERENEHDLAHLVQSKISLKQRLEHLKSEFPGYKAESDGE